MKKLMIALTAVAAAALVAKAETLGVDMTFEGIDSIVNSEKTNFVADSDETIRWAGDAAASESVVTAYETTDAEHGSKYLRVDESKVLERVIDPNAATPIPTDGHIDIAARVQFTASDDDAALEEGSEAKLAVWLKKIDATETEAEKLVLKVTAANENGEPTIYDTDATVEENTWYDLTVVSTVADGVAQFSVAINGTKVNDGQLFNSLVRTGTAKASITSVGFKGTGAVDTIAFTSEVDEKPVEVTVSVVDSEGEVFPDELSVTIDDGEEQDISGTLAFTYLASAAKKIVVKATADGYKPFEKTYEGEELPAGTLTITLTKEEGGTDLPGAEYLAIADKAAYNTWAAATGVTASYEGNPNDLAAAYLLGVTGTETPEAAIAAAEDKVEDLVKYIDLAALAAGEDALTEVNKKLPAGLKAELVAVDEIKTDAKLYKLAITALTANAE